MPTGAIPEVRDEMFALAVSGEVSEDVAAMLIDWTERMRRRYTKPPARITKSKVTADHVLRVLEYARQHPRRRTQEIGLVFNLDGGRVSEIISGEKDHLLHESDRPVAQQFRRAIINADTL